MPAGDFRRGCELVSDLSLVTETARLEGRPERLNPAGQLSVWLTDKSRFGITLLLATGSEQHLEALRACASRDGMVLDEEGLRRGGKVIASKSEEDIYQALGLPFIEPELREGRSEIALAQKGKLPRARHRRRPSRHPACAYRPLRRRRHARGDGRGDARRGL